MYGAESYRTDSPVFRICQDLRAFEFWEGSADLITAYIGTAGIGLELVLEKETFSRNIF